MANAPSGSASAAKLQRRTHVSGCASNAGGLANVHGCVTCVPEELARGEKMMRWDEESGVFCVPVHMKLDPCGFFIHWQDAESGDVLDLNCVRDARTGKYCRQPRDARLREMLHFEGKEAGKDVPLEDKCFSLVFGFDFANVNYMNFCCSSKQTAQKWAETVMRLAHNLLLLNASPYTFLMKSLTKLRLESEREGKVKVKNVIKLFAQHKDDKKRVETALEACGFPSGKLETIAADRLTEENFFVIYKNLVVREEVYKIFDRIVEADSGIKRKPAIKVEGEEEARTAEERLMTVEQFVRFLNREQRDPRLNEILYPYVDRAKGRELISLHESNKIYAQRGLLSMDGFLRYLMSDENAIIPHEKLSLTADMDQPLNHYFINSSHNTYLAGHQFTGKSSVEIYRQCLLAGCRCVELDCWNGRNSDEPIVTHGFTMVSDIMLKEVLEAIAESAFKTSDYPVILSLENHCSPKQQAKIAGYCHKIFGDMLLTEPLSSHPLKSGIPLPSPNQLLRKIVIKNKKKHHVNRRRKHVTEQSTVPAPTVTTSTVPSGENAGASTPEANVPAHGTPTLHAGNSSEDSAANDLPLTTVSTNAGSPSATGGNSCEMEECESESSIEEDETGGPSSDAGGVSTAGSTSGSTSVGQLPASTSTSGAPVKTQHIKESEAAEELSALVNYIEAAQFHSFEYAEKRNRSYETSSFSETQATSLLKERPVDFVNFNKRQLSRIYPRATRLESSNYMPQVFWNAGCQMVALNFQTLDLGMQLNLGIFEYNARSGYLLKPDFMRRADRKFDPFTESTVDGIIAGTVTIQIISAQLLNCDKKTGTYVEVDMFGLPADTARRRRTRTVPANAINPIYYFENEHPFVFSKVVLPDLASIRLAAYEENGRFLGHRILPVVGLRPGYRHIVLRGENGQPLGLPSLFVHIQVKDYVPDALSELADALANPIAYQSMIEKRAKQLEALTEEDPADGNAPDVEGECTDEFALGEMTEGAAGDDVDGGGGGEDEPEEASVASISRRMRSVRQLFTSQTSTTGPMPNAVSLAQGTLGEPRDSIGSLGNGNTSGTGHAQLVRQDTQPRSREMGEFGGSLLRVPSALESDQTVGLTVEPLNRLREHKRVLKVQTEMDRELAALAKKHVRQLEKELAALAQKREKILSAQSKSRSLLAKTNSKLARKSISTESRGELEKAAAIAVAAESTLAALPSQPMLLHQDQMPNTSGSCELPITCNLSSSISASCKQSKRRQSLQFLVSTVPTFHRNLMKRKSEISLQSTLAESQVKLEEFYKSSANSLMALVKDQQNVEMETFDKYHEKLYAALEKSMLISQEKQTEKLQTLHDEEVSQLMSRLSSQSKEQAASLAQRHKSKSEFARMKREMQQRLIEQAVAERQRFAQLLEKRRAELHARHLTVKEQLLSARTECAGERKNECARKMQAYEQRLSLGARLFVEQMLTSHHVEPRTLEELDNLTSQLGVLRTNEPQSRPRSADMPPRPASAAGGAPVSPSTESDCASSSKG